MIFVTVGTHEQQFNRLLREVDRLKGEGLIEEEVIMQIGYSTYEPQYCKWSKLLSYSEMQANIKNAKIVITHGGPASFIAPLQIGKIPIVVPRQKKFSEHVNDHQLEFCKAVHMRQQNICVVEDIAELEIIIPNYEKYTERFVQNKNSNNLKFNTAISEIVSGMFS